MITSFGIDGIIPVWESSTVCIGTFDGVHIGHAAVIDAAKTVAREHGDPLIVVTFDRNPLEVVAPSRAPVPISTLNQNLAEFDRLGVDIVVVMEFSPQLRDLAAVDFLEKLLVGKLLAHRVVVGHDFAFGKDRAGTGAWLNQRIETHIVSGLEKNGLRVSSSYIRERVAAGDFERAAEYLGRKYVTPGVVIAGQRLGRTLGFPTANLGLPNRLVLPIDGVYGGVATVKGKAFAAAISLGTRPTVGELDRAIEAYLIHFSDANGPAKEIYGEAIELQWDFLVRGQVKFDDLEQLKAQMSRDIEEITKRLASS